MHCTCGLCKTNINFCIIERISFTYFSSFFCARKAFEKCSLLDRAWLWNRWLHKLCQSLSHNWTMGKLLLIQFAEDTVFGVMVLPHFWIFWWMDNLPRFKHAKITEVCKNSRIWIAWAEQLKRHVGLTLQAKTPTHLSTEQDRQKCHES